MLWSIHIDRFNGTMTDNTYCSLCHQILETDSDLFSYLKQCRTGELHAITGRSQLPDVGELFKGGRLTYVGGRCFHQLDSYILTSLMMLSNNVFPRQSCISYGIRDGEKVVPFMS